ncbi:MAG: GMC oxidoreductase [Pseudomonadota bacterium]
MTMLATPGFPDRDRFDVIIVGSGVGAGVMAARLAGHGLDVCIFERGHDRPTYAWPQQIAKPLDDPAVALTSLRANAAGLPAHVALGAHVVGGSAMLHDGPYVAPAQRKVTGAFWPAAVRQDHWLNAGFARAVEAMGDVDIAWPRAEAWSLADSLIETVPLPRVAPTPSALPERSPGRHARGRGRRRAEGYGPLAAQPQANGVREAMDAAVAVAAGGERESIDTALAFSGSAGSDAKAPRLRVLGGPMTCGGALSQQRQRLNEAVAQGAALHCRCDVRFIQRLDANRWGVMVAERGDNHASNVKPQYHTRDANRRYFEASIVVLAAGAPGTVHLLARSAERGLTLSSWLGASVAGLGDLEAYAPGPAQAQWVDARLAAQNLRHRPGAPLIVQAMRGEGDTEQDAASLAPHPNGSRADRVNALALAAHVAGAATHRWRDHGLTADEPLTAIISDAMPDASGTLRFTRGGMKLEGRTQQQADDGPHPRPRLRISPCLVGGCRMGDGPETGLVDERARVFTGEAAPAGESAPVHSGLYVCDASLIPPELGSLPMLPLMALAERTALLLARDYGLREATALPEKAPHEAREPQPDAEATALPVDQANAAP